MKIIDRYKHKNGWYFEVMKDGSKYAIVWGGERVTPGDFCYNSKGIADFLSKPAMSNNQWVRDEVFIMKQIMETYPSEK